MGECKPAPTGGHHCQCDHGSVPGLNKRTCVCPEGYTMVKHRENVFLPDAPEYTCEKCMYLFYFTVIYLPDIHFKCN